MCSLRPLRGARVRGGTLVPPPTEEEDGQSAEADTDTDTHQRGCTRWSPVPIRSIAMLTGASALSKAAGRGRSAHDERWGEADLTLLKNRNGPLLEDRVAFLESRWPGTDPA